MLTLFLIRHAKSSWDNAQINDFDRSLNERGKRNAPFMGKQLLQKKEMPDLIVSSPAKRAISTAKLIAAELDYHKKDIIELKALYHAMVPTWLNAINNLPDNKKVVMVFGHNNGITQFANYLTNAGIDNIPTCGIVKITFDFKNWAMVSKGIGKLEFFDYPKKYPENN